MRVVPALAVATLVVLAGCGLTDRPAPPSVTPAPVPADPAETETTHPRPTLAPGVTSSGVDPAALARAHRRTLRSRNVTVRLSRTVIAPNGTVLARARNSVRAALRAERFHGTWIRRGSPGSVLSGRRTETSYWRAGSFGVVRRCSGGETVYALARAERFGRAVDDPTRAGALATTLRAFGRFTVTDTPDGPVTLVGTGLARPDLLTLARGLVSPRAAWLRVTVTQEGVVRSYGLRYRADVAGTNRTVRVEERLTVRRLRGPVEPPPWLPAARNATGVSRDRVDRTRSCSRP